MCDHFKRIYRHQAEQYDRLVAREDQRGNLFQALNEITPLHGLDVIEFGAGTGRLTRLLAVLVNRIFSFDIEPAMLKQADAAMSTSGMTNWHLALGDNAQMPIASACADLVIEGWSFAHVIGWYPKDWLARTDAMLAEMTRILKPGGTAVLIETLGTGRRRPLAPTPQLAQLYHHWESACGFNSRWIRTDYQFATPEEAKELTRFFFGAALTAEHLARGSVILPECTGIWWKRFH